MDVNEMYNDPIIGKKRKGTPDSPYSQIVETLQVINGRVVLTEIPNRFQKVNVSDVANNAWFEVNGESINNQYKVDYSEGVVFFDSINNGKSLTFTYLGEGAHYFPAQRVYIDDEDSSDNYTPSVKDKFVSVDTAILEQKARVDEQIRSVPQPSEIIDMRVDHNSNVFSTAKARVDAEQIKIESAQRDFNGVNYPSLKQRIDAEQKKIEDAYTALDGTKYFSIKDRIDAEQQKIQDTFTGQDGRTYSSMKGRFDGIDESVALMKRRISSTAMNINQITDLKVGEVVRTLGYSTVGDGGAANYEIKTSNDTVDNSLVINVYNGLKAHLIIEREVNVKQFGAKGDGVTNDATVIQKALDLAASDLIKSNTGNHFTVYIPNGIYILTSELYIKDNTYLRIDPKAVLKRKHDGNILRNYMTGNNTPAYTGVSNFTIDGGVFDCNGATFTHVCNGIALAHGENIIIKNVTIKDTPLGHAMELAGIRNILIEDCKFLGYKDYDGLHYYSEAIQVECCIPSELSMYYGDFTTTQSVTVKDCYFGNSTTDGFTAFPTAIGTHGARTSIFYDNMKIINNTIDGASYSAIRPFKFRSSLIDSNLIMNANHGVYIVTPAENSSSTTDFNGLQQPAEPIDNIIVTNNIFKILSGKCIYVEGQSKAYANRLIIANNLGYNIASYGFHLRYLTKSIVSNNILETATDNLMQIEYSTHTLFDGNRLMGGLGNGIFVNESIYLDFNNNTIRNMDRFGFNITGNNNDLFLTGNKIFNPSQKTENLSDGIIISTGAVRVRLVNNTVRTESGYLKPRYGLNIQSGVSGIARYGNDFRCLAITANIIDASTDPTTTTSDLN